MKSPRLAMLSMFMLLVSITAIAQQCTITPNPVSVIAGACVQLQASNCGASFSWSLIGNVGQISATGNYCAPATFEPQNTQRGMQVTANSSAWNVPVNGWPVFPHQRWLTRIATDAPSQGSYHNFKWTGPPRFYQGFPNLPADSLTPQQKMHASLPWPATLQDTLMPIVEPPDCEMQSGCSMDPYGRSSGGTGPDRHMFVSDHVANVQTEYYQVVVDSHNYQWTPGTTTTLRFSSNVIRNPLPTPLRVNVNGVTGACSGMNFNGQAGTSFLAAVTSEVPASDGYVQTFTISIPYNSSACPASAFSAATIATSGSNIPTMNIGSMSQWGATTTNSFGGVDAAGLCFSCTSGDIEELWRHVMLQEIDPACNCVTAWHHAVRTTLGNQMIRADVIAPATLYAAGGHPRIPVTCTPTNPIECAVGDVNGQPGLAYNGADACEAPTPWATIAPATCPSFHVAFVGMTTVGGGWITLQDDVNHKNSFAATAVTDQSHFTIAVDGTQFGAGTWNGNQYMMFDWAPYGTRFRLKASYNVTAFCGDGSLKCQIENAVQNSIKTYGMINGDGTSPADDWDSVASGSNGFFPAEVVEAAYDLHNWTSIENDLEVVDPSGTQPNWTPTSYLQANNQSLVTNQNRVQACVNGTCADVNIQGTAIDAYRENVALPAGGSYQMRLFVTGNVNMNWSCAPLSPAVPGASISPSGLLSAPTDAQLTGVTKTYATCTAQADPRAQTTVSVYFVPHSNDGSIRVIYGYLKNTPYVDAQGNKWYGQAFDISQHNGQYGASGYSWENPSLLYGPIYGTCNIYHTNCALYGYSISHHNDIAFWMPFANGQYTVQLVGESGAENSGAGCNVFDVEGPQGQILSSWNDSYTLSGNGTSGYTLSYAVNVTNGELHLTVRDRQDDTCSPLGISLTGVRVVSGSGPPPLEFSLPAFSGGIVSQPYASAAFTTSGGVPPYSYQVTAGALPSGLAIVGNQIKGTPTQPQTSNFTITASDSSQPPQTVGANGSITINGQQAGSFTITATPSSLTIAQNAQGSSTLLATVTGTLSAPIALSTSSLPSGVSVAFVPTSIPIAGGTSVMTITVAQSAGVGTYPIAVIAQSGALKKLVSITLQITQAVQPLKVTTTNLVAGVLKKPYTMQLAAVGGVPPYVWISPQPLPAGLKMSTAGLITGTPTVSGKFTVNVIVIDQKKAQAKASWTLTIVGTNPIAETMSIEPYLIGGLWQCPEGTKQTKLDHFGEPICVGKAVRAVPNSWEVYVIR